MVENLPNDLRNIKAIILAGGKGTRLAPYTTVLPKPLMPIGELPILEIVIRQLKAVGIQEIIFSVGYLASLLEAYFGNGRKWGVKISYSHESTPLGTAGPLALIETLDSTFLVMNGDLLTTIDYIEMLHFHLEHQSIATVGMYNKQVKIDLGVLETNSSHHISGYVEKPNLDYKVSMGIYFMEPNVLKHIPENQRFDLPDLVLKLLADQQTVIGYPFEGFWLDIGRKEDYAEATEIFRKNKVAFLPDYKS